MNELSEIHRLLERLVTDQTVLRSSAEATRELLRQSLEESRAERERLHRAREAAARTGRALAAVIGVVLLIVLTTLGWILATYF